MVWVAKSRIKTKYPEICYLAHTINGHVHFIHSPLLAKPMDSRLRTYSTLILAHSYTKTSFYKFSFSHRTIAL